MKRDNILEIFLNERGRGRRLLILIAIVAIVAVSVSVMVYQFQFKKALEEGVVADKVLVLKSTRTLILFQDSTLLKSYKIGLGGQPIGKKQFQGDQRTPEGNYVIDWHHEKSKYHLSLHISYPNVNDVDYAKSHGKNPGGDIFIHGEHPYGFWSILPFFDQPDWTLGCIALTNAEIEELWRAVPNGTPIEIRP